LMICQKERVGKDGLRMVQASLKLESK